MIASTRLTQALNVGDVGAVAIRSREGNLAISGSVGGAAAAAAGVGFALGGSAAAATIAAANAAAVAAASTSVAAPSILSGLLSLVPTYGSLLAPLATGTATVAVPAAVTTAPLWVALAGPVGWTLAGIGVLAVPFSWRLSKLKLKDKLAEASEEQVTKVFDQVLNERMPAIRKMGTTIAEEIRLNLDRQLDQVEAAMVAARDHRPSEDETARLAGLATRLSDLLKAAVPVESPVQTAP